MALILKTLLSVSTLALCTYGLFTFDFNMWPMLFSVFALVIFFSIFVEPLNMAAIIVARIMGVMSLFALLLLLLAATVGGAFHLSQSNLIVAVGLAMIALCGCGFFFIRISKQSVKR